MAQDHIEVMRASGRVQMCEIAHHGETYVLVNAPGDEQIVIQRRLGAWFEITMPDVVAKLDLLNDYVRGKK